MAINKWYDKMLEYYNDIDEQKPDLIDGKHLIRELIHLLPLTNKWKIFHT